MPSAPASAPRVLVVDDHRKIREPLAIYLRRFEFNVRTTEDAQGMWALLKQQSFEVIILDVMLPDADGFELCRQLQRHAGPPVILLTARDATADRVHGLDCGADDYLVKPFEPRELVARIHSVLRRQRPRASLPAADAGERAALHCYRFGPWRYRAGNAMLVAAHGASVALSTGESRLLEVFLSHPRVLLNRERLIELTRQPGNDLFDRAIDRQVSRLRRKLGEDPTQAELLRTVWGEGYMLVTDVSVGEA